MLCMFCLPTYWSTDNSADVLSSTCQTGPASAVSERLQGETDVFVSYANGTDPFALAAGEQ